MRSIIRSRLKPGTAFNTSAASPFPQGIKLLHNPEHKTDIDVLFVHGLTGDRERTWTHQDVLKSWPEVLLPNDFPKARILTFGYDAYIARKSGPTSLNRIRDHATDLLNALSWYRASQDCESRPIIIVAHSLGGLVCKDAVLLSNASSDPHLKDLAANIIGIAFMGTPHGGSWMADWLNIPVKTLGVIKSTNCSLLSVLRTESEVLDRLHDDFLSMIRARERGELKRSIEISCFCEALAMPVIGPIVPSQSASLPGFNKITIHANHRDIVRFKTRDDPGYEALLSVLSRWYVPVRFGTEVMSEHDRLGCLRSLSFGEMEMRRINIDPAIQGTCTWIYENATYKEWKAACLSTKSIPLLWLKGKPGSGKSTMMRELYDKHVTTAQGGDAICLGFFFNGRGQELEKTPLGLYRTLVRQLIQQSSRAMQRISFPYKEKEKMLTQIEWHLAELKDFFHQMMNDLGSERVEIFIDALDECNDDEVRRIVKSFEGSLSDAMVTGRDLRVCWSSRYYPHIGIRSGTALELRIECHNNVDIMIFVQRELVLEDPNLQQELSQELIRRANGVFLWTVLVIKVLLIASDRGLQPRAMRTLLNDTPSELHELFKSILCTLSPRENETLKMFQWVLGSREPLSPNALRLALLYSRDATPLAPIDSESEGPYSEYERRQYERYIVNTSGGLLEVVHSQVEQPNVADTGRNPYNEGPFQKRSHVVQGKRSRVVQVIHESVSDFFIKGDGAKTIGFVSSQDFTTAVRSNPSEACLRLLHDKWVSDALATADQSTSTSMVDLIMSVQNQMPSRHLWSVYPDPDFPVYVGKHGLGHLASRLEHSVGTESLRGTIERWSILYNGLLRAFLISADDLLWQTRILTGLFKTHAEEIKNLMGHFDRVFDDLLVIQSPGRRGSVENLRQEILLQRFAEDPVSCKYFSKGNCKFGAKCAFAHTLPDGSRVKNKENIGMGTSKKPKICSAGREEKAVFDALRTLRSPSF